MNNKDILYRCLECGKQEIVKVGDHMIDGRVCKECKGHLAPIGFIGIDLASRSDVTVYSTPGSKKSKNSEYRENGQ